MEKTIKYLADCVKALKDLEEIIRESEPSGDTSHQVIIGVYDHAPEVDDEEANMQKSYYRELVGMQGSLYVAIDGNVRESGFTMLDTGEVIGLGTPTRFEEDKRDGQFCSLFVRPSGSEVEMSIRFMKIKNPL